MWSWDLGYLSQVDLCSISKHEMRSRITLLVMFFVLALESVLLRVLHIFNWNLLAHFQYSQVQLSLTIALGHRCRRTR
ncbi:hypothetical protein K505DRAFT_96711 [Melanomma pulvis-pyrius CBS 109.77]|uniref:Uncharacterized protein n=1 Tax=Melanomma pulvis-pyrius CBS 109.77 TaxID=1314802 RepID=A0A6A6WZ97_9PLEO|nr:hypothetical protein K505DRAFT_96711 [Melanomma pulvis-pyrius CBS 109.77]